ncbi:MAG: 50S ribosomal protein L22 [Patescibacteria group bacterium]|nr:50S ribosomal protein L22 [Patescibacteria group bacterium]
MEIKASVKYIRKSPRKVRLVVDLIRGLDVKDAENQLKFTPKLAKEPILKLLRSAIANAENNFQLKKENLFIKKIVVDEGPTLKRWHPRAHGRAATIRKRSSHIDIVLGEKVLTEKKPADAKDKNKEIKK